MRSVSGTACAGGSLDFNGWQVVLADEGAARLRDGERVVIGVRVRFPDAWRREVSRPGDVEADSATLRYVCPGAHAVVRHAWGALWHLVVEVTVDDPEAAISSPLLEFEQQPGLPPTWLIGSGVLGHAVCFVAPPAQRRRSCAADEPDRVLHWRQIEGSCQIVPGLDPDADRAVALFPPGALESVGVHRVRWRAEALPDLDRVTNRLPAWLPPTLFTDVGDLVRFRLPDAAVTCDRGEVQVRSDHTDVLLARGRQLIEVAQAEGVTRLVAYGVRGPTDDLRERVQRILVAVDARLASGADLWLTMHAQQLAPVNDFLVTAADEVAARTARQPRPDPFAVAALAGVAGAQAELEPALDVALAAVERWRETELVPGAVLATQWVGLSCVRNGVRPPPRLVADGDAPTLIRLESAIVGNDPDAAARPFAEAMAALGIDACGESSRPLVAGQLAAVLRLAPDSWRTRQLATPMLARWEYRLRAGADADAAWLHW